MTRGTPLRRSLVLVTLLFPSTVLWAETSQEHALFNAPSPHVAAGGPMIAVHRTRLHGYLGDEEGNAKSLAFLKQSVQQCVATYQKSGKPSNPPKAWPSYVSAAREDTYMAANRIVRYTGGVTYVVNPADCSLMTETVENASLTSSLGACNIDITHKTAEGFCDASGHAKAAAGKVPTTTGQASNLAMLQKMAADPKTAAMAGALMKTMKQSAQTGASKFILGISCEVHSFPGGGTVCLAPGGSFTPARLAGNAGYAGLLLEMRATTGYTMTAVDAKLDDKVASGVFTPYLGSGYTVDNKGPLQ
jgi:hypothetical protein